MNAAFSLGAAPPSAITHPFAWCAAGGAWHASDRKKASGGQRMWRKLGLRINCSDIFARGVGKGIEFQSQAIGLDQRNGRAQSSLVALATVDPGGKGRQRPLQWLHFTNPAARIRIGEPQVAFRILEIGRASCR